MHIKLINISVLFVNWLDYHPVSQWQLHKNSKVKNEEINKIKNENKQINLFFQSN